MSISIQEVVLEGVYAGPDSQERIVREIVNGKVVYEVRVANSEDSWAPGHALANTPSIEIFAAACTGVTSKPKRYARHDTV
jgi:hypothetical protein